MSKGVLYKYRKEVIKMNELELFCRKNNIKRYKDYSKDIYIFKRRYRVNGIWYCKSIEINLHEIYLIIDNKKINDFISFLKEYFEI